jgi:hypothetical protein
MLLSEFGRLGVSNPRRNDDYDQNVVQYGCDNNTVYQQQCKVAVADILKQDVHNTFSGRASRQTSRT